MGKYPVIFLSLKSVDGLTFEDAKYRMTELIGLEAERFGFLEDSEHLSENEKKRYKAIISLNNGMNTMNEKNADIKPSGFVAIIVQAFWKKGDHFD